MRLLPVTVAFPGALAVAAALTGEPTSAGTGASTAGCPADRGCDKSPAASVNAKNDAGPHYYWPTARGRLDQPGRSPYRGPKKLSASLAWTWHHPDGQYAAVIISAPLIDDEKNLYISTTEDILKFNAAGRHQWWYRSSSRLSDNPGIWNGTLYTLTDSGELLAISMETGKERWKTTLANSWAQRNEELATVTPHEGRVFVATARAIARGRAYVAALSAVDGTMQWKMSPSTPLWSFLPMFPGDGSLVFQTVNGDPYALRISDGTVIWNTGREGLFFTLGGTMVGPNGVAYTTHGRGPREMHGPYTAGDLSAYNVSDGSLLWRHQYSTPANSWAVMAQMGEERRWTVLFPYGGQAFQVAFLYWLVLFGRISSSPWLSNALLSIYNWLGLWGPRLTGLLQPVIHYTWPAGVTAFEPETGRRRWQWEPPPWPWPAAKGDHEGTIQRITAVQRGRLFGQISCLPHPWSSPTADADGTVFLGYQSGVLYALQESGGQGRVADSFQTSAAFNHPGAALAPGMLAIANCDSLYVFRYGES